MEIANLVLEYLKVLVNWPLLVLALAWMFKDPLSEFLRKLKKVGFPGGSLDAEADEASSEVDEVRIASAKGSGSAGREVESKGEVPDDDQSPAQLEPDASEEAPEVELSEHGEDGELGSELANDLDTKTLSRLERELSERRKSVDEGQYYESYRQLALTSPAHAVREAYQRVRLTGRRMLQDTVTAEGGYSARSLRGIVEQLSARDLLNPDAIEPAGRLDRIYMSANTDGETLSAKGALSFIDAAQKLDALITEARRFALHQRRLSIKAAAPDLERLLAEHGYFPPVVTVSVMGSYLMVKFPDRQPELESDPRFSALLLELNKFSRHTSIPIRIRHRNQASVTTIRP